MSKDKHETIPQPAVTPSTVAVRSEYSLVNIEKNKPAQLKEAIACLSEGLNIERTKKATGFCRETILAIQEKYEDKIGPLKQMAAIQCRRTAVLSIEAAQKVMLKHMDPDDPFELSANLIPVYVGVLSEKWLLLAGEATSRSETVEKKDYQDLEIVMAALAKGEKIPPKQEIIDVTPED